MTGSCKWPGTQQVFNKCKDVDNKMMNGGLLVGLSGRCLLSMWEALGSILSTAEKRCTRLGPSDSETFEKIIAVLFFVFFFE
jgi:hypothetical protein